MTDISYEDAILGASVLSFDGRVLEMFNWQSGSAGRLNSKLLYVEVEGPDKKGRRSIIFSCAPSKRGGGFRVLVDESQWPRLEPLVNEVSLAVTG
ncbi:MAG: hypothetical protein Q7T55_01570 [Solirubrobacteraceae bacterium]|nr:hypothetical protein [Solirubrobacteraceae bacterium]